MILSHKSWSFCIMLTVTVIVVFISLILIFMQYQNRSIAHPLPITHDDKFSVSDDTNDVQQQTITVVASSELQQPLNSIVDKFKQYYPYITPEIKYISQTELRPYIENHPQTNLVLTDESTMTKVHQLKQQIDQTTSASPDLGNTNSDEVINYSAENETDTAPPFDFAISKQNANDSSKRTIQGFVINPDKEDTHHAVVLFKRFLLASSVQKLLKDSDLESVEIHNNSIEYLFSSKKENNDNNDDVADLSIDKMVDTE